MIKHPHAIRHGLSASDKAQVRALAEAVRCTDGVDLKLDWDLMGDAGSSGDFYCFAGDQLVGYAQIDGNSREQEVTAATFPDFRRQGIFHALLTAVRAEVLARGAESLLLVSYRASLSGTAAAQALGLPYVSSEYRMEADASTLPPLPVRRIQLVPVGHTNLAALATLTAQSFGGGGTSSEALAQRLEQEGVRYFLAELDGQEIGQIGVVHTDDSIYIRGVGILPEYRRRGYGRQLLAATVKMMLAEGQTHFLLDVATDNPQALSLYQSCGFRETTVYDYYDVPV
jgi:ribosomal protein S18 acetylase RimI-like enzyme